MTVPRILLLSPQKDGLVNGEQAAEWARLAPYLAAKPYWASASQISILRDQMLAKACEMAPQSEATHVVWSDADQIWLTEQVLDLCRACTENPTSAYAALVTAKHPAVPIVGRALPGPQTGRYQRMEQAGFGLVAFDADALLHFASRCLTYRLGGREIPLAFSGADPGVGEDTVFWRRWREFGNRVYTDLECRIVHVGQAYFAVSAQEDKDKVRSRISVGSNER